MASYRELTQVSVSTRTAAQLTGISRATATRKPRTPLPLPVPLLTPANKLNQFERARILDAANSPDFVDLPPIQIYARLLDSGVYLGSISTIYRVLGSSQLRV